MYVCMYVHEIFLIRVYQYLWRQLICVICMYVCMYVYVYICIYAQLRLQDLKCLYVVKYNCVYVLQVQL